MSVKDRHFNASPSENRQQNILIAEKRERERDRELSLLPALGLRSRLKNGREATGGSLPQGTNANDSRIISHSFIQHKEYERLKWKKYRGWGGLEAKGDL